MRKRFYFTSIVLVSAIVMFAMIFLIVRANFNSHPRNSEIKIMPDIFLSNNETYLSKKNFKGQKSIFIYFNSECSFCQLEIEKIYSKVECLNNYRIVLITCEDLDVVKKNTFMHWLLMNSFFEIYQDKNNSFSHLFNITTVPTVFLYNEKLELVDDCVGINNLDEFLSLLSE